MVLYFFGFNHKDIENTLKEVRRMASGEGSNGGSIKLNNCIHELLRVNWGYSSCFKL